MKRGIFVLFVFSLVFTSFFVSAAFLEEEADLIGLEQVFSYAFGFQGESLSWGHFIILMSAFVILFIPIYTLIRDSSFFNSGSMEWIVSLVIVVLIGVSGALRIILNYTGIKANYAVIFIVLFAVVIAYFIGRIFMHKAKKESDVSRAYDAGYSFGARV